MLIRNESKLGALVVPSFRLHVDAGDEVEVSEEIARALLGQVDVWIAADDEARAIAAEIAAELAPAVVEDDVPPAPADPPATPPAANTDPDSTGTAGDVIGSTEATEDTK